MQLWRENAHILTSSAACSLTSALASALFIASHQGCNRVTQLSKSQQCMCMYRSQFPVTCYPESVCFANNLISRNVTKLLQGGNVNNNPIFYLFCNFPKTQGALCCSAERRLPFVGTLHHPSDPPSGELGLQLAP